MDEADVRITLIAAVAENGVIGRDGDIPWRIPSDFRHFKRTTMGKPMVMGRKQFESVGRPLPGRANIVVTRQTDYAVDGVETFPSLDAALARAREFAAQDGADELIVIGGGDIYRQAMPLADRLIISHVGLAAEGEILFPTIDPDVWEKTGEMPVEPDERDESDYFVAIYERRHRSH
ncbi:MAG: dihydrofolate reductase [Hyphomicrobiaceae bacterium]|nr:dihydrofolate reductase [Hyphomicrobiaceae bacterium]MCC0024850.1 dihydrofolate reductase [Hyphomicrobiaceae bacterium]